MTFILLAAKDGHIDPGLPPRSMAMCDNSFFTFVSDTNSVISELWDLTSSVVYTTSKYQIGQIKVCPNARFMNAMINRLILGLHLKWDLSHLLIISRSCTSSASIVSGKRQVPANHDYKIIES